MKVEFKRAQRTDVKLLIGLIGGTGSGKTYSAMKLASGMSGGKPFAVIDTESGRALHYADEFVFDHAELNAPFRPDAYIEAIKAADEAGYPVIVIDSMSHVWAGDGGILDWQEDELERMAGDNWQKRDAVKMAAWIKPKMAHKSMMQKLLQLRNAHVIMCFRAEQKIEMAKEGGKTVIREKQSLTGKNGWIPVCEKNVPFELTVSLLFSSENSGMPIPIKLPKQLTCAFDLNGLVNEECGNRLREWSSGGMTLDKVLVAIDSATCNESLAKAATMARQLTKQDDIASARRAYAEKAKELANPPAEQVNAETGDIADNGVDEFVAGMEAYESENMGV